MLLIINKADLQTLLNLRLTKRSIRDLISAYEGSISTAIVNRTFTYRVLKLRPQNNPTPSIEWLIQLQHRTTVGQALALMLFDSSPLVRGVRRLLGYVTPGSDPSGDEMKGRVKNGLSLDPRECDTSSFRGECTLLLRTANPSLPPPQIPLSSWKPSMPAVSL